MSTTMIELMSTLGHAERLNTFRLLVRRYPHSVSAGHLAEALGYKRSTLSVYLSALRRAGLVHQDRVGNSLLYSADLHEVEALTAFLLEDCCRGRIPLEGMPKPRPVAETDAPRRYNVLFICTRNSARSIFSEAILRDVGAARFNAYSAGTMPTDQINPVALAVLKEFGHDADTLRPKGIDAFQAPDAPQMDFIFTVCDQAADEDCPAWPGQPITAHWGHPDPAIVQGTDAVRRVAFRDAYRSLERRISPFAQLCPDALDRAAIQQTVDELALMP
ncbi:ArsR family transcriptional regulator [Rhodobacteraceae bacterium NNCM2]|nr:ArsR family transcriptional regulator [Coraliihabitans acroporae]